MALVATLVANPSNPVLTPELAGKAADAGPDTDPANSGGQIVTVAIADVEKDMEQRLKLVDALRRQDLRLFTSVVTHCLRAYYSSELVLRSLSSGAVPPFPEGNPMPEDDWSLLEPVYLRGPLDRPLDTSLK